MGKDTSISWTDDTWNPIRGCSRKSAGCQNCYAERVAGRFHAEGQPYEGLTVLRKNGDRVWNGTTIVVGNHLADPLRWRGNRKIFVNSMSDLFHESIENTTIAGIVGIMAASADHTFQVLTKRPEEMLEFFDWLHTEVVEEASEDDTMAMARARVLVDHAAGELDGQSRKSSEEWSWALTDRITEAYPDGLPWPLPNVWFGVSTEDQATFDERVPLLARAPAAVRFVSAEPLLGPIDLRLATSKLDWVISGCESGPGARPADVEWFASIAKQCTDANVAHWLKQMVADSAGRVQAGKGSKTKMGDIVEPPFLDGRQYTQFPTLK